MPEQTLSPHPDPEESLRAGRLAALLFTFGALSSIPVTLAVDPRPEPWVYSLTALGVLSGIVCWLVPWDRISPWWLRVVPAVAAVEISVAVAATSPDFNYLFLFLPIYVGLVLPRPVQMLPYLLIVAAAVLAPLAYEPGSSRETLFYAAVIWPLSTLTALVIGQLRLRLEENRDLYRLQAARDELTGVGSRRAMLERLDEEIARHRRRGREFSLLVLDLDGFKAVNDDHGHLVGDGVLALIGSLLDLEVRTEDSVFRHGGDEFSVLAPDTGLDEALQLAERLRVAMEKVNVGPATMTATVGVAVFPVDGVEAHDLIGRADEAMMSRKRSGGALFRRVAARA